MTTPIREYKLSKSDLIALPDLTRQCFLDFCWSANELGILQRLFLFNMNRQESYIEKCAQKSQAILFSALIAGKLSEVWKLIRVHADVMNQYSDDVTE